jgi:hypothetical protein
MREKRGSARAKLLLQDTAIVVGAYLVTVEHNSGER